MATVQEIMPRLLEEFPQFRKRWDEHVAWWDGEAAGNYNDMAEFVHFVVEELYPAGDTESLQKAFALMENWLCEGRQDVIDLVGYGFFENLRNAASWKPFGYKVFLPYLGTKSKQAWSEIEQMWAGKNSLAEVIRAERKR